MKALITGSRSFALRDKNVEQMKKMLLQTGVTHIIEGGAKGADRLAREAAQDLGITGETVKADWDRHGNAAGSIRNTRMVKTPGIDFVLAFFVKGLPCNGTEDLVKKAIKAGIPVLSFGKHPQHLSWLKKGMPPVLIGSSDPELRLLWIAAAKLA